jgi:hypothetical protein
MFLHNLLNILVQIVNKMGLQKKNYQISKKASIPTCTCPILTVVYTGENPENVQMANLNAKI